MRLWKPSKGSVLRRKDSSVVSNAKNFSSLDLAMWKSVVPTKFKC